MILDPKRSNAINIGLTVLPPIHVIKTAILNFDEFAINKEGIEVRRDFLGYLWVGVLSASETFYAGQHQEPLMDLKEVLTNLSPSGFFV